MGAIAGAEPVAGGWVDDFPLSQRALAVTVLVLGAAGVTAAIASEHPLLGLLAGVVCCIPLVVFVSGATVASVALAMVVLAGGVYASGDGQPADPWLSTYLYGQEPALVAHDDPPVRGVARR